ncbi:MAG: sulfite reductase subunit alpha [Alphaproteobacteria bacterium]|nr:sulfite reductase subunit alpha [Alphaproteobacteria bacterium]
MGGVTVYIPKLPEEAPFSAAQRAWLNGYFAGMMGGDTGEAAAAPVVAEEDFPWHDPAFDLDDRLAMAKDRALPRRLMAAMAQLDCGQCGYLCQTYGEAIASGAEKSLGKCVPGGKETSKALRALMAEAPAVAPTAIKAEAAHPPGRLIAEAVFKGATPLNGAGSAKDTRHVVFDLSGTGLDYRPGDAFGLYAPVDPALVDAVVAALGSVPSQMVEREGRKMPLRDMLSTTLDIARPGDSVVETMMKHAARPEDREGLAKILDGAADAPLADPDLLDLLLKFPFVRPPLDELLASLEELQPRLYSIASSPRAHEGEVHLTIGVVRYRRNDRARQGVASTFLAERHPPGARLRCFVQPAHGFRLPDDLSKPVIMIGPGTGIAPFRAFLEERRATQAPGKNWLFFGDQHEACDFIYRDEIEAFQTDGTLTRLDLAFSRDGAKKIYVQDRMRDAGAELWAWLNDGAHVYVCGDASRMARDVDAALREIVAAHGNMDETAAKAFVQKLAADKRYQRDVY